MNIEADFLGVGYEKITLRQSDDYDGEIFTTIVRKRCAEPALKSVLYIHGFQDYFFQTELAEKFNANGFDFYALDLRKCGRSHRPHQLLHFNKSFDEYNEDIDSAIRLITEQDGHQRVLLAAHSTGGISAALYADAGAYKDRISAVFFNSPFFGLNEPKLNYWSLRIFGGILSLILPKLIVQKMASIYALSMHKAHHGQWDFNTAWKPTEPFPIRVAWISSVLNSQKIIQRGLSIECPILLMHSARSKRFKTWSDDLLKVDSVLNIEHMKKYGATLGRDVTRIEIQDGVHDLVLSDQPVRGKVYAALFDWLEKRFPE